MSTLVLLLVLIAGSYWNINFTGRIICSSLIFLLNARMFMIYHDYQHRAILRRSKFAHFIMMVFGWYILAPESIWKRSHDYHHKHNSKLFTASIGSYPIMTKRRFITATASERRAYLFTRHPLSILFGYFTMFIYGICIRSFITNPKRHFDSLVAIVFHLGLATLLYIGGGWTAVLLTLVIPFFMTGALGSYLFYVQHNFVGVSFKETKDWSYDYAALASSSYLKMSKLMHWFTGNIGYHHIHHINSRIPFYRLPEAFKKIPELHDTVSASLKIKSIIECLRLKVWDPEKHKMIGLKDLSVN